MALERSRPIWSRSVSLTTTPVAVAIPNGSREIMIAVDAESYAQLSGAYTSPSVSTVAGIVSIFSNGTPTGGTFKLRVLDGSGDEETTGTIAYNASAATIKTALVALNAFESGDITSGGGALPTTVTMQFTGGVWVGVAPRITVVDSALTGGTNPSIVARLTTLPLGNGGYGYVPANTPVVFNRSGDLRGAATDRYLHIATVASTGTAHVTAFA